MAIRSTTPSPTLDWSPTSTTTPRRLALVLGPDPAGNMLELIVLQFDDGRDIVIHAVPMRRRYERLVPPPEPTT